MKHMQPRFVIPVLFVFKRCNHRDATTVCNFITIVLKRDATTYYFSKRSIRPVITVIPKSSAQSSIRPELIMTRIWMCLLALPDFLLLLTVIFRVDHYHCVSVSGAATVSVWFDKTKCIVSFFVWYPPSSTQAPAFNLIHGCC